MLAVVVAVLPTAAWAAAPAPSPSGTGAADAEAAAKAAAGAAAKAGKVVTFGVQPANGKTRDGRPGLDYGATPGALVQDHVAVINLSTRPIALRVYTTDTQSTADGTYALKERAVDPVDVGAWTSVPEKFATVRVPARTDDGPGQVIVPLTMKIPKNAQPGDHSGAVLASLTSTVKNAAGTDVDLEQRVASRINVRISGPLEPALAIENLTTRYEAPDRRVGRGSVRMTYTVKNTGNVRLGATQFIRVTGWFGTSAEARDVPPIPELLPGGSVEVSQVVDGVTPTFRVSPLVQLTAVPHPGDANPAVPPFRAMTTVWAVPWVELLIVVLVVLALWWRRRRGRAGGTRSGRRSPVAAGGKPSAEDEVSAVPEPATPGRSDRRAYAVVLGLVGAAVLAMAAAAPAHAEGKLPEEVGGLSISPATGTDLLPVLSFSPDIPCQADADYYFALLYGPGLPDTGQLIANANIGLSTTTPFTAQALYTVADVIRSARGDAATVTPGRYVVEFTCSDELIESTRRWTGSLTFTSPRAYTADPVTPRKASATEKVASPPGRAAPVQPSAPAAPTATTTEVTLEPGGPVRVGDDVTIRAAVSTTDGTAATGAVAISLNGRAPTRIPLDEQGRAVMTVPADAVGEQRVVAGYEPPDRTLESSGAIGAFSVDDSAPASDEGFLGDVSPGVIGFSVGVALLAVALALGVPALLGRRRNSRSSP